MRKIGLQQIAKPDSYRVREDDYSSREFSRRRFHAGFPPFKPQRTLRGTTNPYTRRLKKPVTIRLDVDAIDYFKKRADGTGIPYQTLISLYLYDCATRDLRPEMHWS